MLNFFQKFRDFVARPTHSRTMGLVVMLILLAAVSLTVIVAQQQQQLRQRAEGNYCADTTINKCPPEIQVIDVIDGNTCTSPNFKCKIGNNIYKCAKE